MTTTTSYVAGVDFETFYSKDHDVRMYGTYNYARHPETDIYLVTIATNHPDVPDYVGPPADAPWEKISGPNWTWVSHNKGFDYEMYEALIECGILKHTPPGPGGWFCTADMSAFFGVARGLKGASKMLLGREVNKETRDSMKGKRWADMDPDFQKEVMEYAMADAANCRDLWLQYGHKWPEFERIISNATVEMTRHGVPVNVHRLQEDIVKLRQIIIDSRESLPWDGEKDPKGNDIKTLSPKALAMECRKNGIEPPASTAQDSPVCEAWENKYGDQFPWVRAMRTYRKANALLKKLEAMERRIIGGPNGEISFMNYGIKMGGAHTLRDAGEGGVNLQNLAREPFEGVDIRGLIEAPPGHQLLVADESQIEPRVLAWLCGDEGLLNLLREDPDMDLYEAQARTWGWFPKPFHPPGVSLKDADPELRYRVKQTNLGLGYQMSPGRYASETGLPLPEAKRAVEEYRRLNRKIVNYWKALQGSFRKVPSGGDHSFVLPSGRQQHYRDIRRMGGLSAVISRNGQMTRVKLWGGVLCENIVQAVARDVFMYHVIMAQNAGFRILLRVHDEMVCLVREEEAEKKAKELSDIMGVTPPWIAGLPLKSGTDIMKRYKKT